MPTGLDLLNLASLHVGETYVFGAHVAKNNPNWKGPWDCAEFVSWCVYQLTDTLYGCDQNRFPAVADAYTGYWRRDAETLGKIVTIAEAARTPGAFLLRHPQGSKVGHVVICDGEGGTIEAHSSATGVCKRQVRDRRWDTGVYVPGIDVFPNETLVDLGNEPKTYRLTSPWMHEAAIQEIQAALQKAGFNPGPIDGIFGPQMQVAVIAFQAALALTPDGEVGPKTLQALGLPG